MKKIITFGFAFTALAFVAFTSGTLSVASEGANAGTAVALESSAKTTVATSRTADQCCRFERLEARNQFRIARLNHEAKMLLAGK